MPEYIAITPARDEERFLPNLIACMAAQTHLPNRWILINDSSTDATGTIVEEAARRHSWIEAHHLTRNAREPGGRSLIRTFLPPHVWRDMDFIFRVEADVSFGPDFVALLLAEFARDQQLGIASGRLYERVGDRWLEPNDPLFHTFGPAKMYSAECFTAIGGLEPVPGWDTIDEMRAIKRGFRTCSLPSIRGFHHRPQGSAAGILRGRRIKGHAAYYAGYSPVFLLARALRNAFQPPLLVGSLMMLVGYLEGYLRRWPMVVDAELIRFFRRQQHRRLMMLDTIWR
jgi:biofilm PGA synthesis N-glycosyltransferase PgaC